MLEFVQGDIFDSPADIRVNTVNCVGVMGAGVALAFKNRYPAMFDDYRRACKRGEVQPGKLHIWRELGSDWVVNFPTKRDWRDPSRYEDIEAGLDTLSRYLKPLNGITVAVPALGCGHGGLNWDRVSEMIREKLSDLDARILVFPPSASRQATRKEERLPSIDEIEAAERLGYRFLDPESPIEAAAPPTTFVKGPLHELEKRWIALMPSREPTDREWGALRSIAKELGSSSLKPRVALLHQSKTSEEIAKVFANERVHSVLLLPAGILTRKSVAKLPDSDFKGFITILSNALPSQKWSRHLVGDSMKLLRGSAVAAILSDPHPDWVLKHKNTWQETALTYVRYDGISEDLRAELAGAGARAIARRSADGSTNLEALMQAWGGTNTLGFDQASAEDRLIRLSVNLCDFPESSWDAVIGLLRQATLQQFNVEVEVGDDSLATALQDRLDRLRQNTQLAHETEGAA